MSRKALHAPRQGPADNGVIDFGACAGAMTNVMPQYSCTMTRS